MRHYKFTLTNMKASMLTSGQAYQRPISPKRIKKITDNFNWNLVNPIRVSHRIGKYFVWDGQHTLTSIITLYGKDVEVPVCVYDGLTYQDEAYLAALSDDNKKKMAMVEIDNALLESNDHEHQEFVEICNEFGWNVDFSSGITCREYYVQNPSWVFRSVYRNKGKEFLKTFLSVFDKAFHGDPNAMRSPAEKGICTFMKHFEGQYDFETLVDSLRGVDVTVINDNAVNDHVRFGDDRFAYDIFLRYNKKATQKKKLQNTFKEKKG